MSLIVQKSACEEVSKGFAELQLCHLLSVEVQLQELLVGLNIDEVDRGAFCSSCECMAPDKLKKSKDR